MIRNLSIFALIFYICLVASSFFMESLLPRIKNFFPDTKTYSYQNYINHDEKPINVEENFPPQRISLFKDNGERNDVHIDVDPASHYPYRNDLIKSLI